MNVALPRIWEAIQVSSFRAQRAVVLVAPLSGALCYDCFPWAARLLALAHGYVESRPAGGYGLPMVAAISPSPLLQLGGV